jgi:hypothetical protein
MDFPKWQVRESHPTGGAYEALLSIGLPAFVRQPFEADSCLLALARNSLPLFGWTRKRRI